MNEKSPLVSVVIPTYNRENLVGRAIKSVLSQTFEDFELIVVDDASLDNTEEVIKRFQDSRIKYVQHQKNMGAPATRNTGIRMAKGAYIGLLDDDDEWLPTKLDKQVNRFKESSGRTGVVYSGFEVRDQNGRIVQTTFPALRGNLYMRLLKRNMIGGSSMIKSECFEKVGLFDRSLKSCQDWDMWLRISEYYEFDFVPEILSTIHLHGDQISSKYSSMIPGRTRMIQKHMDEFRKHPDILVIHLKRMGKLHCINGTWKEAVYWFRRALVVNPFEIIKIVAWCVLELPKIKMFSRERHFKRYRIEEG
ncbi:MAG: glycosyltransferase [Planctomycetes bacterium]|nr:glycosyltransferase [Planctomycetota bacterium]